MSGTQILWKKDRAANLTVRLVRGTSPIQYLNLHAGRSFGPLRVGSAADWCVTGEGVQPIHLSLMFDGTDLFISAASASVYVSVNGQPLNAGQWIPVGISSEICFGSAVFHLARGESQPPPGSVQLGDESGVESTLSDGGRLREIAQRAREAAGAQHSSAPPPAVSPSAAPPAVLPTPVPAAGQPPLASTYRSAGAPPPTPTKGGARSAWREASLVKKITLFLLPLAAVATWFTWEDPAPAPQEAEPATPAPASSTPGQGSASVPATVTPPTSSAPSRAEPPASSASGAPAAPPPAETASSQAPPTVASDTAPGASAPAPSASAGVLMLAPGSSETTPRAAIDAAFSGRLESAKELYAKLAAAHPDKPELALAKRRIEENAVRRP